ncbi:Barstar (Barnase inhibitor) OS=Streptomyces microflavus OX=1919 GN=G3I39_07480 PE=4 SV=1 [Streptomyces microflavus]
MLDLWDRRTGFVQEIWSCKEFEVRPLRGAGTGHRGAFQFEPA